MQHSWLPDIGSAITIRNRAIKERGLDWRCQDIWPPLPGSDQKPTSVCYVAHYWFQSISDLAIGKDGLARRTAKIDPEEVGTIGALRVSATWTEHDKVPTNRFKIARVHTPYSSVIRENVSRTVTSWSCDHFYLCGDTLRLVPVAGRTDSETTEYEVSGKYSCTSIDSTLYISTPVLPQLWGFD